MKYFFQLLLITFLSINCFSQSTFTMKGTELGIDLSANGSTLGGNVGLGLKYGINLGEYFIVGPSLRYEYLWWNGFISGTAQVSGNRNVYGGGIFAHARFMNALFVGAEFEMLKSPYDQFGYFAVTKSWAPTLFIGGGFSMEFNEVVRINAGIMYDVINAGNSPFRRSYMPKTDANGNPAGFIPLIYRIAFFFPLTRSENNDFSYEE